MEDVMVPESPSYSLDYFEGLFGARTPAFWELVSALIEELESYGTRLESASERGDGGELARLRHDHRPLIENLRLGSVGLLEEKLKQASEEDRDEARRQLARTLAAEVLSVAKALTSERFRAAPGPRRPSRDD